MIRYLLATEALTTSGGDEVTLGVFVPAIMGAGVVFSLATVVRDLVERGTSVAAGRNAEVRGRLAAGEVLGRPGQDVGSRPLWHRGALGLTGVAAIAFAIYLAIGTTYNYFYPGGYLGRIAWLWTLSLALVALAAALGTAALLGAARGRVPGWSWQVLVRTPLLAPQVRSARQDRLRWTAIGAAVVLTILSILLANPSKVQPIDSALSELADAQWLHSEGLVATWAGSTPLSLAVAVVIGVATWGCARFARLFLTAALMSLGISVALRALIDRPRPPYGPWADAQMSYPSGHLTQVTLLAVLVPLAVFALTRRPWTQHAVSAVSVAALVFISANRMAVGVHWPTDVLAGILLGLAIGLWTRASLLDPAQHRSCRRCAFHSEDAVGAARDPSGGDGR
jgi:membrane-associated phospholipid phosphatase